MKRLIPLCLGLLTATLLPCSDAAETTSSGRVVIDWAGQQAGGIARPPNEKVFMLSRRNGKGVVADSQGAPTSPFPGSPALTVKVDQPGTGEENVAMVLNPFSDSASSPAKGWVEMEVAVDKYLLVIGVSADAADPSDRQNRGRWLANVFLRGDDRPILVVTQDSGEGKVKRTPLIGQLTPNAAHTLRIAWDWEASTPGLRFFLDGAPLALKDGGEIIPVDVTQLGKGVNLLNISLTGKGTFLGRIRASE